MWKDMLMFISTPKVMPAIALSKLLAINYCVSLNFIRLAVL